MYVNGALNATGFQSLTPLGNLAPLSIGQFGGNSDRANGLIDEVRISNEARTQAQIQSDMNTPIAGPAPPASDTTKPSVAMTAPAAGALVSGTVAVTANASDNVGVAGVQFTLDGSNLGAEDTSCAVRSFVGLAHRSTNGSHSLAAVARDAAGNRQTASTVTVSVSNDTSSPTAPTNLSATAASSSQVNLSWSCRHGQRRCHRLPRDPQRHHDRDDHGHDVQRHRARAADHVHVFGRRVRRGGEHLGGVGSGERNDSGGHAAATSGERPRRRLPLR